MFPQSEPARVSLSAPHPPGAVRSALGFTMIELLVVISIVGVLAALIIPAVSGAKASGQAIKCVSNLRQIYVASLAWSTDNAGRIVPVYDPGDSGPVKWHWAWLLAPYLGRSGTNNFKSAKELPVAVCPVNPNQFGYAYNYAYLSFLTPTYQQWATMPQVAARNGGLAKTVFLCDRENQAKETSFGSWRAYVRPPSMMKRGLKDSIPSFRHPGNTANVLWLDGHVSAEKADGTWMNPDDKFWGISP